MNSVFFPAHKNFQKSGAFVMKIRQFRLVLIGAMALGLTVGCATTQEPAPEPEPAPPAQPAPAPAPPPAPRAQPAPPPPPTTMTYEVVRGDSLWRISGRSSVYGNPYQWPLIYKANASEIRDADLIYPGQRLTVELNPSQGDVDAAVRHARTRGAWELGRVEDSDVRYLEQYGLRPRR
jgi:hypothetical protein